MLRLREFGEQVDTLAARLVCFAGFPDFLHLGLASCRLFLGKVRHRENSLRQTETLHCESDRILLPHQVQQRHLANGTGVGEETADELDYAIDVFVFLDEPQAFAPG